MKCDVIFFSLVLILCVYFILSNIKNVENAELYIDKSGPLIGTNFSRELGFEGDGIRIGVIDTGIDYNHPDLFGLGPDGKVVGGYDYVDNDETPMDTNGHGTEVAGIIASDGQLKGIAPKSKLLAYRVSATGESVSSDFIIKAIHRAIEDKVDIINISLGVNKTNDGIDNAVAEAVRHGVVVVVAAGNNGPGIGTIGSPAKSTDAITVGASYNNITSSLVSTLDIGKKQYEVLPMIGTKPLSEPINAKIVFGGYGRTNELSTIDVRGSIILVERGSDIKDEKIFFSEKEYNAAQSGASAIIVYNNEPGIFFGELVYPDEDFDYKPSIPALSMSRDDGIALKTALQNATTANLNVFYHPDFVTPFSSRGPVSPFYIKPDLIAPGVFVNSTLIGSKYNLTSGTSFAAPHVSGATAILLEKNLELKPSEISSLLSTTSESVSDPYGNIFPVEIAGSGRINLAKALSADLIIIPHNLVFNLSIENLSQTKTLNLKSIKGILPSLEVKFFSQKDGIKFEHRVDGNLLNVKISVVDKKLGDFEGIIVVNDSKTTYRIPVLIHITKGTINVIEKDGILNFDLSYPDSWSYAKITVINKDTKKVGTTSITPNKSSSFVAYDVGEHWIESQITTPNGIDNAYTSISIQNPLEKSGLGFFESFVIPIKQILIISTILGVTIIIGLRFRPR